MNEAEAREFVKQTDAIWRLEGAEPDEKLSEKLIQHLTGQITEEDLVQYVQDRLAERGVHWNPTAD